MPAGLAARPVDPRWGLPVPAANVHLRQGEPVTDFTALYGPAVRALERDRACGLCAEPLGYWVAFLGGPKAAAARTYTDPPMHPDCAEASLRLCPHIRRPAAKRASQHRLHAETIVPAGFDEQRPTEWVLGVTRAYRSVVRDGVVLFHPRPFKRQTSYGHDEAGELVARPGPPPTSKPGDTTAEPRSKHV